MTLSGSTLARGYWDTPSNQSLIISACPEPAKVSATDLESPHTADWQISRTEVPAIRADSPVTISGDRAPFPRLTAPAKSAGSLLRRDGNSRNIWKSNGDFIPEGLHVFCLLSTSNSAQNNELFNGLWL